MPIRPTDRRHCFRNPPRQSGACRIVREATEGKVLPAQRQAPGRPKSRCPGIDVAASGEGNLAVFYIDEPNDSQW
jgi:hypothetical protein